MRGSFFLRLTAGALLDANDRPADGANTGRSQIAGHAGTDCASIRRRSKQSTLGAGLAEADAAPGADKPAHGRRIREAESHSAIHGGTSRIRIGRAPQGGGAQPCSLVSLQGRGPVKACRWQRGAWALTGSRACGIGGADADRCDLRTLTGNQLFGV